MSKIKASLSNKMRKQTKSGVDSDNEKSRRDVSPFRRGQGEAVESPRDSRGWTSAGSTLEGDLGTRLQGLIDEAIGQHRCGICRTRTMQVGRYIQCMKFMVFDFCKLS